ncbi:MAG: hypothetical protein ACXWV4_03710 [Flavitalea sp.]
MRKTFLFLSIVVISAIGGCAKKESKTITVNKETSDKISGSWELRQLTGQIGTKRFPAGNGNVISFSGNEYTGSGADFGVFGRTDFPLKGKFEIVSDTSVKESVGLEIPSGEFTQRFMMNEDTTAKFFFQVKDKQLRIMSGYFPLDSGVELVYEKQ